MTEQDLPMLHDWLNRPHIVEWWGGDEARPTLSDVLEEYAPANLARESVTAYIAMLGDEPIGYAQSYVALGSGDGWWEDETDPGVRGIDQSLANPSQLGRGLGTKLVRALVEMLFQDPAVTKIQTDPAPNNLRAIRCYEKADFVRQKTIVTPDGPAAYMVQTRQAFEQARSGANPSMPLESNDRHLMQELRFSVFGRIFMIRREGVVWQAYAVGNDGKRAPAGFVVPDFIPEDGLAQYLADLFHENATPTNADVRRIR
jgi:aminoglycoside 6'-N-acetyltransferase-1b/aminoglycoside 6'-N-acetyltransferase-2